MGLVALALLHVAAATHQFEHDVDHGFSVCESCSAYSQLEDSAIPVEPALEIFVSHDVLTAATTTRSLQGPVVAVYRSRAPPLS